MRIGAILGGGWYADGLGWLQTRYNFGPPPVRLLVQLESNIPTARVIPS